MNGTTMKLTVDFARPEKEVLHVVQGDAASRSIEATLLENGQTYTPGNDALFAVAFRKQDTHGGIYDTMPDGTAAVTLSSGKLLVKLAGQVTTCAGETVVTVTIYTEAGKALHTFPIYLHVHPAAWPDDQPSDDYYNLQSIADIRAAIGTLANLATGAKNNLVAAINELDQWIDNTEHRLVDTQCMLASPYSSALTYAVGDYCVHSDALYRCKVAISTQEPWTAAHWERVTVAEVIDEVDSKTIPPVPIDSGDGYLKYDSGTETWGLSETTDDFKEDVDEAVGRTIMPTVIAKPFSSSKTYAVGDLCSVSQENSDAKRLYRCKVAIETPENWNEAHWEQVTVGEELDAAGLVLKALVADGASWKTLQLITRAGLAPKLLSVGQQFTCKRGNDTLVWDVLGFDCDTPANANFTHSVTLGLHDCYTALQFSMRQALFYFPNGLAAGTYNFTVKAHNWVSSDVNKTFQFMLTNAIPAGGQIVLQGAFNVTLAGSTLKTYASATSDAEIETATITEGSGGTSLGDVGNAISGGTNVFTRALQGNNNYGQSALRQYLNSSAAAGSVWTPKNVWDRAPIWAASTAGFLNGMDEDFLAVIGEVTKKTALNTLTDGGGSEDTTEKFFLLSRSEVYGGDEVTGGEGAAYPYYADGSDLGSAGTGSDSNRIKNRNGSATYWWLRSPYFSSAHSVRNVQPAGNISGNGPNNSNGVAPACCIV